MQSNTAISFSDLYGDDVEWVQPNSSDGKYHIITYNLKTRKQLEIRAINRNLLHHFNGTCPKSNTKTF